MARRRDGEAKRRGGCDRQERDERPAARFHHAGNVTADYAVAAAGRRYNRAMRRGATVAIGGILLLLVALCGNANVLPAASASSPTALAVDTSPVTVTYTGSLHGSYVLDPGSSNVLTRKWSVDWTLTWTGPLNDLIHNTAVNSTIEFNASRSVTGSFSESYSGQPGGCADTLSAGRHLGFIPVADSSSDAVTVSVFAPTVYSTIASQSNLTATPTGGQSCFAPTGPWGFVPCPDDRTPDGQSNYCTPDPVWHVGDGPKSFDYNHHVTDTSQPNVVTTQDLTSTVSVSGSSCAAGAADRSTPTAHAAAGACRGHIASVEILAAPVVVDRDHAPPLLSTSVVPCMSNPKAQWVACSDPSKPDKAWPIVLRKGQPLEVFEAKFKLPGRGLPLGVKRGKVVGVVSGAGRPLKLTKSNVSVAAGQTQFTVRHIFKNGALAHSVQYFPDLSIHWQLLTSKGKVVCDCGSSRLPVYVTLGAGPVAPLLSLVHLGTAFAKGATDESSLLGKLWPALFNKPARNGLHRYDLDRSTWTVKQGKPLSFWDPANPWTVDTFLAGKYHLYCELTTLALLERTVATCQGIAALMIDMLRLQGVDAGAVHVTPLNTLRASRLYQEATFFLVGRWTPVGSPNASGQLFNRLQRFSGPDLTPGPSVVRYAGARGQNNNQPPGWWAVRTLNVDLAADHQLVDANGRIWDPSYGGPSYPDTEAWARKSIAGWARITSDGVKTVDFSKCGTSVPSCEIAVHLGFP